MSGIVCYIGHREAVPVLVRGLRRLEYRGYDSAGLATVTNSGHLHVRKLAAKIADPAVLLKKQPAPGCIGIGHARRATHGLTTDINAQPHLSFDGRVAVVHNGVIENYAILKRQVQQDGISFRSDTDTEVIAQLITCHLSGDLQDAVRRVLPLLRGTYGLAAISSVDPDRIIVVRLGSPLVVGIGDGECFLASDPAALVGEAQRTVHLEDNQLCELTVDGCHVFDQKYVRSHSRACLDAWETGDSGKGSFEHSRFKESREQA